MTGPAVTGPAVSGPTVTGPAVSGPAVTGTRPPEHGGPGVTGVRLDIALFEGAEERDSGGPWEGVSAWALPAPADGVEVCTVAQRAGPVTCAKGLRVLPDHTWDDHPPLDVLVYPGGHGTRRQLGDAEVRRFVRATAAAARLVARLGSVERARQVRRFIQYDPAPPV